MKSRPPARGAVFTIAISSSIWIPNTIDVRTKQKRLADEDTKGARRMPWHRKSTKDVASCDKPRGGANGPRSADLRMGEPAGGNAPAPPPEYIGRQEATRGTETSQYPEEEKSNEIARVAASESARAQTGACGKAPVALPRRGCGARHPGALGPRAQSQTAGERNGLGRPAGQGESPVRGPRAAARTGPRVGPGTWNPVRSWGDHPPRLNTIL